MNITLICLMLAYGAVSDDFDLGYETQIAWGSLKEGLEWLDVNYIRSVWYYHREPLRLPICTARIQDLHAEAHWSEITPQLTPNIFTRSLVAVTISTPEIIIPLSEEQPWAGIYRIRMRAKLNGIIYDWGPISEWFLVIDTKNGPKLGAPRCP